DHPPEAAAWIPAQRIPAGTWNARRRSASQGAEVLYFSRAGFYGPCDGRNRRELVCRVFVGCSAGKLTLANTRKNKPVTLDRRAYKTRLTTYERFHVLSICHCPHVCAWPRAGPYPVAQVRFGAHASVAQGTRTS